MLKLDTDLQEILLIAIVAGLLGGIVFELLLSRRGQTGRIELPARKASGRVWDPGFLGSMFVGAAAAIVFLLVYQPVEVVANGSTTKQYPTLELIAMSLVVGAAGSSILGSLTKAAIAAAERAKLEQVIAGLGKLKQELAPPSGGDISVEASDAATVTRTRIAVLEEDLRAIVDG